MGFSLLTSYTIGNSGKFGSRNGARLDRFIVHHGATTGWQNLKDTLSGSGREVSANYTIGNGETVGNVPEAYRAYTTGAASWDARAITVEVKNSTADPNWQVAENDFHALAKLIADVSIRYGFEINDNTVLTHQEIYKRYGASYPTACPGDLQRRKAELLRLANQYRASGLKPPAPPVFNAISDADQATMLALFKAAREGQIAPSGKWTYDQQIASALDQLTTAVADLRKDLA